MFSVVSVCSLGAHVTITHDALDLTVQGPPAPALALPSLGPPCTDTPPQRLASHPLLVTSGGQDWRPVQTCSLEYLTPSSPVLTSVGYGREAGVYASYWNAFLFTVLFSVLM